MSNWVLYNIDPTVFNVVSDAVAQVAAGILVFALGAAYPYLLWSAVVKRGHGIPLDSVLVPQTLFQSINLFKVGSAWLMPFCVAIALLVAYFAHTCADVFLKFETAQVSTEEILVLGSQTVNSLPSYGLVGDKTSFTATAPFAPLVRLVFAGDAIVQGLSRFSIFQDRPDVAPYTDVSPCSLTVYDHNVSEARPVLGKLGVQCHPPINVSEIVDTPPKSISGFGAKVIPDKVERFIPVCDFERDISEYLVQIGASRPDGWKVLGRTTIRKPSNEGGPNIGFLDSDGEFSASLIFTAEETALPIFRDDWALGRRVRDGLTIAVRDSKQCTFQVEHSVLSWPNIDVFPLSFNGLTAYMTLYTMSSWSRNCPVLVGQNTRKTLTIQDFSKGKESGGPSGCIINTQMSCHIFPDDDFFNQSDPALGIMFRLCSIIELDVTLVKGVSVNPIMLAMYSSMLFHNFEDQARSHSINQVNALAAAYIMTRQIESASLAVNGVRPSIDVGYLIFMILPIVVALPLIWLYFINPNPPIPNSIWKAMVFGQSAGVVLPSWRGIGDPFPSQESVRLGIVKGGYNQPDRLGFVGASRHQSSVIEEDLQLDPMEFTDKGENVTCPMPPSEQTEYAGTTVRRHITYRTNPDGTKTQVITTKSSGPPGPPPVLPTFPRPTMPPTLGHLPIAEQHHHQETFTYYPSALVEV